MINERRGGSRPKTRPDDKRGGYHGGGRPKLPTVKAGNFTIHVANVRAMVVRWTPEKSALVMQEAQNWEDLEPQAIKEIETLGGSIFLSAQYPCSNGLAAKAEWK